MRTSNPIRQNIFRTYVLSLVLMCVVSLDPVYAEFNSIKDKFDELSLVAKYCSAYGAVRLREDRKILCLDGEILQGRINMALFHELEQNGFFVVRSSGGFSPLAVKLANILYEKNATVIIHDYCFSACANYLFVATSKTYVLKNTLVAWHGGPPVAPTAQCSARIIEQFEKYYLEENSVLKGEKKRIPPEWRCVTPILTNAFFQKRGIDGRHTREPQTAYMKQLFDFQEGPDRTKRNMFWMWHPKNYGNYFQSRIEYESYPKSQAEVDDIKRSLKLPIQIYYDPPLNN